MPHSVNPLDTHFHKQRIHVSDFYYPLGQLNEGKTFEDCEFQAEPERVKIEGDWEEAMKKALKAPPRTTTKKR